MTDVARSRPFPFVVGCGRSGTTLVRAILDSHPDMAVPPEVPFVIRLDKIRSAFEGPGGFDVDAFVERLWRLEDPAAAGTAIEKRWELSRQEVRDALVHDRPNSYEGAVRSLFALYARKRNKARFGDKIPNYVRRIDRLATLFPEARFIHVIRDGRNVALSAIEMPWGPQAMGEAALWWKREVDGGRSTGHELGPSRYLEIRLEDLIAEPQATTERMCDFVQIGFDPAMLDYYRRATEVTKNLGSPHPGIAEPPTGRFRDWKREASRDDITLFEWLAGDLLRDLGYETTTARRPTPRVVVRGGIAAARFRLARRRRKAAARRRTRELAGRAPTQ